MTISELVKIENLFKENNWEVEKDKDIRISLYNKFLHRYKFIDNESKELFLDLSKRFLRIQDSEVYSLFKEIYNDICGEVLKNKRTLYIFPLINPFIFIDDDIKKKEKILKPKIKSGQKLKFLIELNQYRELEYSEKISLPDYFNIIEDNFEAEKDMLILIDDYIGSGNTAVEILNEIFKDEKFSHANTLIISLVAQEVGIQNIKNSLGVKVYCKYVKKKAITDFYNETEREENKEKVIKMERKIKCPKKWSLGYEKSEALVSIMNKSPNNTLPIFWWETETMIAPFHRYIKYK